MKSRLLHRHVDRQMLAEHLGEHLVIAAESLGEARLYRCRDGESESLAIALPDGSGLLVELSAPAPVDRRRRAR